MRKRVQLAGVFLLVALASAAVWVVLRERDPVYQGKSLSAWLGEGYQPGISNPQIAEAIQHIGTNAIPRLLALAQARDSFLKAKMIRVVRRQRLLPMQTHPDEEKHGMAAVGFYGLGPMGEPAVPALVELLKSADPDVRSTAARCLAGIGPGAENAVRSLMNCLSNALQNSSDEPKAAGAEDAATALGLIGPGATKAVPLLCSATNASDSSVRNAALIAFTRITRGSVLPFIEPLKDISDPTQWCEQAMLVGEFGTNAGPAIPALIAALTNNNDRVNIYAAATLGRIHVRPKECVPALVPLLSSPNEEVRETTLWALGSFGPAATSAAPVVTRCLADTNVWVRKQAAQVLKAMDSGATKAGVK